MFLAQYPLRVPESPSILSSLVRVLDVRSLISSLKVLCSVQTHRPVRDSHAADGPCLFVEFDPVTWIVYDPGGTSLFWDGYWFSDKG